MNKISIVVPTLNEAENIPVLGQRVATAFEHTELDYEIVFVDDRSIDGTRAAIEQLMSTQPVRLITKNGPRGKAYSLLQGFEVVKNDVICMIDADLQYPPEAIIPMYRLMVEHNVDVVLTERENHGTTPLRQLSSKVFNFAFTRLLFGFNYDSQSGLKLFKKSVLHTTSLNPTPWSFDLEFIVRALENNFRILNYKIPFSTRYSGQAKVRLLKVTYELARASIKLRFNSSPQKVKQAYRMNLQLAARLMCFLLIPCLGLIMSLSAVAAKKVSALSVLDLVPTVTSLVIQQPAAGPRALAIPLVAPTASSPATTHQPQPKSEALFSQAEMLAPSQNSSTTISTAVMTENEQSASLPLAGEKLTAATKLPNSASTPTYPPSRPNEGFAYNQARRHSFRNVIEAPIIFLISVLMIIGIILSSRKFSVLHRGSPKGLKSA